MRIMKLTKTGGKPATAGGFDWGIPGITGSDSFQPGGQQAAPEVAPANSRSLFMRVRLVHEKALKKGSVSLFHKKL